MPRFTKLCLVAVVLLGSCARKNPVDGQNVGNGGDPLAKLFERARAHSLRILERVSEIHPEAIGGHSVPSLKAWYAAHRGELTQDVSGTPPYTWLATNPNLACGHTSNERNAPVRLSYQHCRGISTVRDAAIHLIGESVHHFGERDDAFTAAIAVAVAAQWDKIIGASPGAIEKRLLFEQGRIHASEVILRINAATIPNFMRDFQTPVITQWLTTTREGIAADVANSRHIWVDGELSPGSDPEEKCLATPPSTNGDVELSYSGCTDGLSTRERAGQLILASTIFHLRGNRDEARRIAALAYAAWFNMGHPEKAHWLTLPPHTVKGGEVHEARWTGRHILVWSYRAGRKNIFLYDPRTNLWKRQEADMSDIDTFRKGESFELVGDSLVNFGDCYSGEKKTGSGTLYNLKANAWSPMTREGAPQERWFGSANAVSAGGKLILIGGSQGCVGTKSEGMPTTDFAAYDPANNKWNTKLVPPSSPVARTGQTVVNTGKSLLVWGGRSYSAEADEYVMHNDGAEFDFEGNEIKKMTVNDAPAPRAWAQSVWGEGHLVLFGGFHVGDKLGRPYQRALRVTGAVYHYRTDTWEDMDLDGAPQLDANKPFRLIWIGNEVLFVGNVVAYFNPIRNRWRTTDRIFTPLMDNPHRMTPNVFWTGVEVVLWDAWSSGEKLSGYVYYP